jgi:hypothetical protein
MLQGDVPERDLAAFVLPELGRLHETDNQWAPYPLLDQDGVVVDPVRVFFAELQAEGKPASTVRSTAGTCCAGGDLFPNGWASRSTSTSAKSSWEDAHGPRSAARRE